ncbi:30S ribosomal protein S5 [Candidatus Micrarchaeota archaeon]|nr:30S ribosomal protein S5 [Candidatus Micrarchaeota archaeon]
MADRDEWVPRTQLGKLVRSGEVTSIEQAQAMGLPILEPQIVEALVPDLKDEVLEVKPVQRTADSGRRTSFMVTVVIGDRRGHVGVGIGKAKEVRPAIERGIREAKRNITYVKRGCGSWECRCGSEHSVNTRVYGRYSSVKIEIVPAPKGTGVVAGKTAKKVLEFAGIKDAWSRTFGNTGTVFNFANATLNALRETCKSKKGRES